MDEIAIKYYKGYEHKKITEISGKEIDRLAKDSESYLKRLKELRIEVEKRMQEKTFEDIYANVFEIMKSLFGKKAEKALIKEYELEIVNKAKGNPKFLRVLNELVDMKKKFKDKKIPTKYAFESMRKDSVYLVESLTEYAQRKDLGLLEKTKVGISSKGKHGELFLTKPAFLVFGDDVKIIKDKIEASEMNELNKVLSEYKGYKVRMDAKMLKLLEEELGEFEISL
ncbi:hypothetical protein HOE51_04710 [archaeon]|nr:hypothetical protein [archaeon]